MAKTSKTRYAALGMLSIAPMSGYEMQQIMQQSTANFWSESDGQLYPALAKLAKEGLIAHKAETGADTRDKKRYRLTAKGAEELKKWLALSPETQSARSEFMLKLFFGANASPDISLEHVIAHRYQTKTMISRLIESKTQLILNEKDSPHLPFWLMSIDYGLDIAKAKMKWCDGVIKNLEKMKRGKKT